MKQYCDIEQILIKDIDISFYDEFILFLKESGIRDTTVLSYAKGVRTILYYFMKKIIWKSLRLVCRMLIYR